MVGNIHAVAGRYRFQRLTGQSDDTPQRIFTPAPHLRQASADPPGQLKGRRCVDRAGSRQRRIDSHAVLGNQVRAAPSALELPATIQTGADAEELEPYTLAQIRSLSAVFKGVEAGCFPAEQGDLLKFDIIGRRIGKGYRLSRKHPENHAPLLLRRMAARKPMFIGPKTCTERCSLKIRRYI